MEEQGFWLCEKGHETATPPTSGNQGDLCDECRAPTKLIERSEMTGQEKYESDKDRKEAEDLLTARRQEITGKETEAGQQDATATYLRQQSESSRTLADSLRKL